MSTPAFPIDEVIPAIRDALATHTRLVLEAPPGAGKTTQVPLALRDAAWLGGKKILMLEPRRVAARAYRADDVTDSRVDILGNLTLAGEKCREMVFEIPRCSAEALGHGLTPMTRRRPACRRGLASISPTRRHRDP